MYNWALKIIFSFYIPETWNSGNLESCEEEKGYGGFLKEVCVIIKGNLCREFRVIHRNAFKQHFLVLSLRTKAMDCENTKWNSVRGKGLLCQHCGEPAADQIKGKTIFFYFLHSIDIRYFTCLDVTSYATKKKRSARSSRNVNSRCVSNQSRICSTIRCSLIAASRRNFSSVSTSKIEQ